VRDLDLAVRGFVDALLHKVPALSFATVAELWYQAEKADWGEKRRRELGARISGHLNIFPDVRVAMKWAELSSAFRDQLGRGEAHDLWIAATAIVHDIPLITNNLVHFRTIAGRFPEMQLVHPDL
jgi:tRNA(fMet)-specific endonuclease VapC